MKPTIGRIVHYHFTNGRQQLVTRPAIIVEVFAGSTDGKVNLQAFIDGRNDAATEPGSLEHAGVLAGGSLWATSIPAHEPTTPNDDAPAPEGTWTWPPRA